MIPNLAKDLVFQAWNESVYAEEKARERNLAKLIQYYNHDVKSMKKYIRKYINFQDMSDFPYSVNNITAKIIDKKSMVYKQPPKRLFNGKPDDKYDLLIGKKNMALKAAEAQSNLLGNLGLLITYDDNGYFDYKLIRIFQAYFGIDPMKPKAVKYPIGAMGDEIVYEYWDNENTHYFLNEKNKILDPKKFGWEDNTHPFNKMPIVWLPNEYIIDDFFNTKGTADDLVNANEIVNVCLSAANHKYRFQSFQLSYVSGVDLENEKMSWNYNDLMNFTSPDAVVGSIGHDHDFNRDKEWIKFQIQMIERAYNLNIDWGLSGSTSGFQLVVQNIENQDDIQDMIDICRTWEKDILKTEKMVGEVAGVSVPDDMEIDFSEVKMPISQEEKNKKWEFEFKNGLSTKADYWKTENPDITQEQIEEKYLSLKKEAEKEREIAAEKPTDIGEIFG